MKAAIYYKRFKIRVLTASLYAEYPAGNLKQTYLRDAKKMPRNDVGFTWDSLEISPQLNAILSNMAYQDNFLELPEVKEIFEKYSMKEKNNQPSITQ